MATVGVFSQLQIHFVQAFKYVKSMSKKKLISCTVSALICATLISLLLGDNFDARNARHVGEPRRKVREAQQAKQASSSTSTGSNGKNNFKDPYSNRPRIQTRNGHLILQAGQDKNIDFKTSGSQGSITIDGHKIDSLLDVTKAFERMALQLTEKGHLSATGQPLGLEEQYTAILNNIYGANARLDSLETKFQELKTTVMNVKSSLIKATRKLSSRVRKLQNLKSQLDSMMTKLKKNDCFNEDTGQPVCKNGATCLDTFNGFKCLCPDNFEGLTCELDVDECAKFRGTDLGCQNGAKCVNYPGGYKCECPSQFHGIHCTERYDDCSMSSSKSLCGNGKCINLARTEANQPRYECICDQGWTSDGSPSPACTIDVNECAAGQYLNLTATDSLAWAAANGINQQVGPQMAYPCSQNPFVECINLPGSFQCGQCPHGYTGNGRTCRDIDECQLNNGGCSTSPFVECVNMPGSRRCAPCPPGYTGDGVTCSRVSACRTTENSPSPGGCHPMAKCIELSNVSLNSRICVCPYPFAGHGLGPDGCSLISDAPDVSLGPIPTGSGGNTSNTVNGQPGWRTNVDDCTPDPCLNGAKCQLTDTSFECICPKGFAGKLCDESAAVCGNQFLVSKGTMSFSADNTLGQSSGQTVQATSGADRLERDGSQVRSDKNNTSGRHYECEWTWSVATNMSIKLTLSGLINKSNPGRQVQMFLANSTSLGHLSQMPNCDEYLDVSELLEPELLINLRGEPSSNRKLLARFCADTSRLSPSAQQTARPIGVKTNDNITLISESSSATLEYSFSATRTQFGEPSLSFRLSWQDIEPPCGGQLPVASSGSVSSPKFPDFYPAGSECRYLIRVPAGQKIKLQFGELNLLTGRPQRGACADSLTILDGSLGSGREVLFQHCANNASSLEKWQSQGDQLTIISWSSSVELFFRSSPDSVAPLMRPKQRRGFYLTYTAEPALSKCGGLLEADEATVESFDYSNPQSTGKLDTNSRDFQLALQMPKLFEGHENVPISSPTSFLRFLANFTGNNELGNLLTHANQSRGATRSQEGSLWAAKTRCEYEIRPSNRKRDSHVAIDWIELPTEAPVDNLAFSKWTRRIRCTRSRLTIYDGGPLDMGPSNRSELASFCAGDRYNSSLELPGAASEPLVSSGHALSFVYESSLAPPGPQTPPLQRPLAGFKLRYSSVCQATHRRLVDSIQVELDDANSECLHHIVLPVNNSISLTVRLVRPLDATTEGSWLAEGACQAWALLLDGVVERKNLQAALVAGERRLRSYLVPTEGQAGSEAATGEPETEGSVVASTSARVGLPVADSSLTPVDSSKRTFQTPGEQNRPLLQLSNSQAHDIKQFDVCNSQEISFDSSWNHLSLLFKLNPKTRASPPGDDQPTTRNPGQKVRLIVQYQAEPSCGGVISEPQNGSIQVISEQRIKSLGSYPLTLSKFEQLHRQEFVNPCAWILRSQSNQLIQITFDSPKKLIDEISHRLDEFSKFKARQLNSTSKSSSSKPSMQLPPSTLCREVFFESIELYEPEVNSSRTLCPHELFHELEDGSRAAPTWLTNSNVVHVRLGNNSQPVNGTLGWPGRRPLWGLEPSSSLTLNYQFLSNVKSSQCGGQLIHESGYIRSPRYPFSYPPGRTCVWTIMAPAGQQIRLQFDKFHLEEQANCIFDYLELRNGPSQSSPLIGRFCNMDLDGKTIISHANSMRLTFKSDLFMSRAGFELRFDAAQSGCGGRLLGSSGQLESPNYPRSFAHSADCEWLIEVRVSNRIELTIKDLDLNSDQAAEQSSSSIAQGDYVEIFDFGYPGDGDGSKQRTNSLGRFCHKNQTAPKILSSSNKLRIVYKSQALDFGRGFSFAYRSICKQIELIGSRGLIEAPSQPVDSSTNDSSCSWLIRAPIGSNVSLAISDSQPPTPGSSEAMRADYKSIWLRISEKMSYKCNAELLEIFTIDPPASEISRSSNNSQLANLIWPTLPSLTNNATSGSVASSSKQNRSDLTPVGRKPNFGKLVKSLCGQRSNLNQSDRYIELASNLVYVSFDMGTPRSGTSSLGLRIEWQSKGCGGHFVASSTAPIDTLIFHESQLSQKNRPSECIWIYDMSRVSKSTEFHLDADMRLPDHSVLDPCKDASLIVYDGLSDRAPIMSTNCDSKRHGELIQATSGIVMVKFFTNGTHNYGRGFTLNGWPDTREPCIPTIWDISTPFGVTAGTLRSPKYPDYYDEQQKYACQNVLTARSGSRLRFKLEELEIPAETNRNLLAPSVCIKDQNMLKIRNNDRNIDQVYCGVYDPQNQKDLERSTTIMEQEAAWVEFYTPGSQRGRWKLSYDRLCGSVIYVGFIREFSSPNYPSKPNWPEKLDSLSDGQLSEKVCIWKLNSSKYRQKFWFNELTKASSGRQQAQDRLDADKRLHVNILNFVESSGSKNQTADPSDCLRIFEGVDISLTQSKFNLTLIDSKFQPKVKICKESDIALASLSFVSEGSEIIVMTSGNIIVKFTVEQFDNRCGGEYLHNEAEFASLSYPLPYSGSLDCHYFILSSPGSRINLKFSDFDLLESSDDLNDKDDIEDQPGSSVSNQNKCDNSDYVEIRQLSFKQKLKLKLGEYSASLFSKWQAKRVNQPESLNITGTSINRTNTASNSSSSGESARVARLADRLYELAKLFDIFYDSYWLTNSRFHILRSSQYSLEYFYENSKLLGRFCGSKAPDFTGESLEGEILVRFRSHESAKGPTNNTNQRSPRGFMAKYKIEHGNSIEMLDDESMEGYISSPSYPGREGLKDAVKWTFETKLDHVIQFDLIHLDVGKTNQQCQDSLMIFDGLNVKTSVMLSRLCGHLSFKNLQYLTSMTSTGRGGFSNENNTLLLPVYHAHDPRVKEALLRPIRSSTNVASVIYDVTQSEGLLLMRYKAISKLQIAREANSTANDLISPLDINEAISSMDSSKESERFFEDSTGSLNSTHKACSQSFRLQLSSNQSLSQVLLSSPDIKQIFNLSNQAAQSIECQWTIYTLDDANIMLTLDPTNYVSNNESSFFQPSRTSLSSHDSCLTDPQVASGGRSYVIIHDGATRLAPISARLCLPVAPMHLFSSGRHLLVRYVAQRPASQTKVNSELDSGLKFSTFKARASVGQCGGLFHILNRATLFDRQPGLSKTYANNLDCRYFLFAASYNKVLTIHGEFSNLDLAPSDDPSANANCTSGDYLEIRDLPILSDAMDFSSSQTGRSLGRYCAGKRLDAIIESPSSALVIEFHTDSKDTASGWRLSVTSSQPRSGCLSISRPLNSLDGSPFGLFRSPSWPHGFFGERRCKYAFDAPANQSIELTFLRLNRPLKASNPLDQSSGVEKCADRLDYLADNEASVLRYDIQPLRELESHVSGTMMRQLVKQPPCRYKWPSSTSGSFADDKPAEPETELQTLQRIDWKLIEDMTSVYKPLTADEYFRLSLVAPLQAYKIKTDSNYVLIDYEAKDLLPDEGFVALFRQSDDKRFKCGGELFYPGRQGEIDADGGIQQDQEPPSSLTSVPPNLIESASFGVETLSSEGFIQCEWNVAHSITNIFRRKFVFDSTIQSLFDTARSFKIAYIVFDVLEIPPAQPGVTVFGLDQVEPTGPRAINKCGLNRLLVSDPYLYNPLVSCGNKTQKYPAFHLFDYETRRITLRTKNLRSSDTAASASGLDPIKPTSFFRGVRGFFYEKSCPQPENQLAGESLQIKSHENFPKVSYQPGICQWELRLGEGDYELWFHEARFRPPKSLSSSTTNNQTNKDNCLSSETGESLDYFEIRSSEDQGSLGLSIVTRFCFLNQAQIPRSTNPLKLNLRSEVNILFVSGIKQLAKGVETFGEQTPPDQKDSFGFMLQLERLRNVSDFCRRDSGPLSIYSLISRANREYSSPLYSTSANFLYPKNAHCVVSLEADEGLRFNLTFRGIFDFESSPDCQNDYIQIDELSTTNNGTIIPTSIKNLSTTTSTPKQAKKSTTKDRKKVVPSSTPKTTDQSSLIKRLGRWCGRTKPQGYFISNTNKLRITFHSNGFIEGKGFQLDYSLVSPASNTINTM